MFVAGFIGSPAMNFFPGKIEAGPDGALAFSSDAFSAPLLSGRFEEIGAGASVIAGLRPDDVVPVGHGMSPARAVAAEGIVILAEMLGGESQVLVRLGAREAIAKMMQPRPVSTDERLPLSLNVEKLHLFDASTGRSLRARRESR